MYEIWKQFNQIWLYLSLIQDILCVCLRRYFLYVIRTCSRQWLKSFLSFTNKEQLPQTTVHVLLVIHTHLHLEAKKQIWYITNLKTLFLIWAKFNAHRQLRFVQVYTTCTFTQAPLEKTDNWYIKINAACIRQTVSPLKYPKMDFPAPVTVWTPGVFVCLPSGLINNKPGGNQLGKPWRYPEGHEIGLRK